MKNEIVKIEKIPSYSKENFQQNETENIDQNRRHTNPNCGLIPNLRRRIYKAIKGNLKSTSTKDKFGRDVKICRNGYFQIVPR